MGMYNDKVMEHFMNPHNAGEMESPDAVGTYGSPVCGDMMQISLKVVDGIIEDVKFKTFGCGSAIASSSVATDMVQF
jgi:nitrogen fixation NifU-like protein